MAILTRAEREEALRELLDEIAPALEGCATAPSSASWFWRSRQGRSCGC